MEFMETAVDAAQGGRAEARRTQILEAASACFREHGFHGASISRISKVSGMSPGHIYHYFKNKEEIIAGIVEQDVLRILDIHERLRTADDAAGTFMACVAEGVQGKLEPAAAALRLEILAEAARNPKIAEMVRAADVKTRTSLVSTLRLLGEERSDTELAGCVATLCAMFDGLTARGVRDPDVDRETLTATFQRTVRTLLMI